LYVAGVLFDDVIIETNIGIMKIIAESRHLFRNNGTVSAIKDHKEFVWKMWAVKATRVPCYTVLNKKE
jgi:hypothetical protein